MYLLSILELDNINFMSQIDTKRPRRPWLIGTIVFFLLGGLCALLGVYIMQISPAFYAAPSASVAVISWPNLPTPTLVHPQWTTFSSVASVRDVLSVGDLRWVATDGGLLVQDRVSGESTQFGPEHGLPTNRLTALALGVDRRVWVGSQAGVAAYDGRDWHIFTTADGLPSDLITALVVDRDGVVWAGTEKGLARFDGDEWSIVRFQFLDFSAVPIRDLLVGKEGDVWAATDEGIWRFDGRGWEHITLEAGLINEDVRQLTTTPDGRMWAATAGGLGLFSGGRWSRFTVRDGLRDLPIAHVAGTADNTVLLSYGEVEGQEHFDIERFDGVVTSVVLSGADPIQSLEVERGGVWLGTANGAWHYDQAVWQKLTLPDRFLSPVVHDLLETEDGLWFAGSTGVSRWQAGDWEYWPLGDVRALTADGERVTAAFGSVAAGVTQFDPQSEAWVPTRCATAGHPLEVVWDGALDPQGRVWYLGAEGVAVYDPLRLDWTEYRAGWPQNSDPHSLAIEPDGTVWVGMAQGLYRLDEAAATWRLDSPDEIRRLAASPAGGLWWVNDGQLVRRTDDGKQVVDFPADVAFTQSFEATAEALWVSTDRGVARWQDGSWRLFEMADGLPSSEVSTIAVDPEGRVWLGYVSSRFGFSVFDPVTEEWGIVHNIIDPHAPNQGHEGSFRPRRDVVQSVGVTAAGQVWFGTQLGNVGRVAAGELLYEPDDYRLYWTDIKSVLAHPDGSVWVAGLNGYLARYVPQLLDDGEGEWLRYRQVLNGLVVSDVLAREDQLWLATDLGVVQFEGEVCDLLPFRETDLIVSHGRFDPESDGVWWGTINRGVLFLDPATGEFTRPILHMRGRQIGAVGGRVGRAEEIWFADQTGLFDLADEGRETIAVGREVLGSAKITAFVLDQTGRPWVGSTDGLLTPEAGDWLRLTTADGLAGDQILAMEMTADGVLWLVTDGGVSRYVP